MIDARLERWGNWKRNYVCGLGFPSSSIEAKIQSKEIFGDGNKRGGRNESTKNGVSFREDPEAEQIDRVHRVLAKAHHREMSVLSAMYVLKWNIKKVSREMNTSRYDTKKLLERAKTLIEGSLGAMQ